MTSLDDTAPEPSGKIRAGRYTHQTSGYSAFIPRPLPPVPALDIDLEMQNLLAEAVRELGRLEGSIQTLPNPDLFVFMYVRKEAALSSEIEGTQASMNDLLKAEAGIFDPQAPSDVDELVNYVRAMNHGLARLEQLPLSIRLIQEIHALLLEGVRGARLAPGELRRSQNWIGPQGSTLRTATFVPPPPHEAQAALGDLESFLHAEDHIPPLIKIGLAHAQFETIHPFLDGNGRVGRLLITFFLCQRKILEKPVLYLSHYFKRNQSEYYHRLQATRDTGDWEGWLKFFLRGVAGVAAQATETARHIVELREMHRATILDHFGASAGRAIKLLENLYDRPTITINGTKDLMSISFPSAAAIIEKMVRHHILFEITGNSRNRVFFYSPYVDLFNRIGDR